MSSFRFILTTSSHFAKSLSLHFYAAFCQLCRKVLQNSNSPPPINLPSPSSPTEAPPSSRGARQKPARGLLPPPLRRSPHHPTPSPPARYGNNQKSPTLPPATLPHRSTSPLQGETRQRGGQIGRLLYHSTLRQLGAAEGAINRVRGSFGCFFACNEGVLFRGFFAIFSVFLRFFHVEKLSFVLYIKTNLLQKRTTPGSQNRQGTPQSPLPQTVKTGYDTYSAARRRSTTVCRAMAR